MTTIDHIIQELVRFRDERDWKQFHNPKDLAISLSVEASELLECFQWKESEAAAIMKVKEELADVFCYGLLIAEHYGLNVEEMIKEKINTNRQKYPIEKAKGSATKYNEL